VAVPVRIERRDENKSSPNGRSAYLDAAHIDVWHATFGPSDGDNGAGSDQTGSIIVVIYTRGRLTRAHYAQTQARLRPRAQVTNLSHHTFYDINMTMIFAPHIAHSRKPRFTVTYKTGDRQMYDDLMTDQGDERQDRKLAMARHFAEAIATAARENLSPCDRGRFVSTVRNLARADLKLGKFRHAA
jgi:hypothetical protein